MSVAEQPQRPRAVVPATTGPKSARARPDIADATNWPGGVRKTSKRLGDIIVGLGFASSKEIEAAVSREPDRDLLLGMKLLKAKIIDDAQLAKALAMRFGIEFTDLARPSDIDPAAVATLPERIARRYVLLPTKLESDTLTVAMACPSNVFAIDAVRASTGLRVKVQSAPESAIRQAMDQYYEFGPDLESTASELASVEIAGENDEELEMDIGQMRTEAEDAPVVKYVDSLISHAIHDRASDIHIEPRRDSVSVRMRVDGNLRQTIAPPKNMQNAVISRIKILSTLDIAEKRLPLDGRIRVKVKGREVDLRVSTLPTIYGEKVVLRVLDKSAVCKELDALGAGEQFLEVLQKSLHRPNGMILVTGPTGSGKSTTLYGCLNYVKDVAKNIITVEDPVEYEMDGITQVAARPDIGMTFARALRSILRQDPDVVMVGEMRDLETLEIGIRASLTGHLVLSTLHTNDAVATITRMINMGAEPYLIGSTLVITIAQRLVRRICEACKEGYDTADVIAADLAARLGIAAPKELWRGRGCPVCGNTGHYGRMAVFEYFLMDGEARDMVTHQAPEVELRNHQKQVSSGNLFENALRKAVEGVTTIDEAMQLKVAD